MALDKHQLRQARDYAVENGLTHDEGIAELFPDEPTAPPRKRAAAKVSTTKEPTSAA